MLHLDERYEFTLAELRDAALGHGDPHNCLSFAIDRIIRASRSREQITPDQRDTLGGVLDEIGIRSDELLVGGIDRARFDDGFGALISIVWLWAEHADNRRKTDEIADAYAHARMLQNWAHNVCLAREIHARGERRQKAFADRYLATSGNIFA